MAHERCHPVPSTVPGQRPGFVTLGEGLAGTASPGSARQPSGLLEQGQLGQREPQALGHPARGRHAQPHMAHRGLNETLFPAASRKHTINGSYLRACIVAPPRRTSVWPVGVQDVRDQRLDLPSQVRKWAGRRPTPFSTCSRQRARCWRSEAPEWTRLSAGSGNLLEGVSRHANKHHRACSRVGAGRGCGAPSAVGRRRRKVVPWPTLLSTLMLPPSEVTMEWLTESPSQGIESQ